MHYIVKLCKYIYLRRRKNRWSCSAGRLLPASAGASVLRSAARWSAAGSFPPAAVCASAIGILWAAGAGLLALVDSKSKGKKNPFTVEGV